MKTRILFSLILLSFSGLVAAAEIVLQKTPDDGLQPRLSVDADGGVHLMYFKKRINRRGVREGNLYYREYDPATGQFGLPVKITSQGFNLPSVSIGRSVMALDGEGRVHVLWYLPRESEFRYSRSNPERTRFEPFRSMVSQYVDGIDAGGEIVARGNEVAIIWGAGDLSREYERTMFSRFSHDGGETFGEEFMISNPDLGACACCSMAAEYMDDHHLLVAYRSAIDGIGRHMQLLTINGVDSEITGASYGAVHELQQWDVTFCPLSTNDIVIAPDQDRWLVFETEGRILQMNLSPQEEPSRVGEPFIETRQKNPAVAFNRDMERVVVWGEAISHSKGGRLNLRLFDADGADTGYALPEEIQIGDFSFPAAANLPNGDFLVLY